MGRFQEYKPISFDIPTFTPDFDALYKLQDQKQKRLDDFNNNTDLLVSSIKAAPIDEADKAKKIQDIYSKKDLVVNELLKNPTQGASVLKRFQSDLKKDVLFGDIYKMNQRNADREARMKEIEAASYGKDVEWKNYAIKQLDNSYGKFYDEKGFGKTSSTIMDSPYFDLAQLDALGKAATAVAVKKFETAMQKDPTLKAGDFQDWWSKQSHEVVSAEEMAGSAANYIASNPDIQKYWEKEGEISKGMKGQGILKLNEEGNGFSNDTMIGQWLNHYINAQAYDNYSTQSQLVTDHAGLAKRQHDWQVEAQREQDRNATNRIILQANLQAAQDAQRQQAAEDLEYIKQGLVPPHKIAEATKVINSPKATPAQKAEAQKTLDYGQSQAKFKASVTGNNVALLPTKTNVVKVSANADLRGEYVRALKKNAESLLPLVAKINSNTATLEDVKNYRKLAQEATSLQNSIAGIDRTLENHFGSSEIAKQLKKNSEFQNADTQGSSYFSDMARTTGNRVKSMINNWDNGSYGWAALDLARTFGNTLGLLVAGATDIVTGAFNMNDYSATDIERGTRTLGSPGGTTPIPNYIEKVAESIQKGHTFQQFLETPTGKAIKQQSTFGGNTFGILDSVEEQYKTAQRLNNNGVINIDNGMIYPAGYAMPLKKIGGRENDDYSTFNQAVVTQMSFGTIKPDDKSYSSLPEKWANEYAMRNNITDRKVIADIQKSIVINNNETSYGIDLSDPNHGYYSAQYELTGRDSDGKPVKVTGTDNGFSTHSEDAIFTKTFNSELTGNNQAFQLNNLVARAMHNPSQALDISNIYDLPKGNTEAEIKQRSEGVPLTAIVPYNEGKEKLSLATIDARISKDIMGNYSVSFVPIGGERTYLPTTFKDAATAYVTLLEALK